ncbi:hypothetical protein B0T26DRAFT_708472, partial [Lasiosphaeria miniovina]
MSAVNVYCLLEEPSKNYLRPWTRSSYISIYVTNNSGSVVPWSRVRVTAWPDLSRAPELQSSESWNALDWLAPKVHVPPLCITTGNPQGFVT